MFKKIDNKGQAFSVFELMIAAIVAIAILFVLLPIIQGITPPTGDARSSIGNELSSGGGTTSNFELKVDEVVRASHFAEDKGIDPCSLYFDAAAFNGSQIEVDSDQEYEPSENCNNTQFRNSTSRAVNAKARVVCEATVAGLESTLDFSGDLSDLDEDPASFWDEEPGFEQVCVVILQRAR